MDLQSFGISSSPAGRDAIHLVYAALFSDYSLGIQLDLVLRCLHRTIGHSFETSKAAE